MSNESRIATIKAIIEEDEKTLERLVRLRDSAITSISGVEDSLAKNKDKLMKLEPEGDN